MNKQTAVIFDLDGVLCEEFPVLRKNDGTPDYEATEPLYKDAFAIEQNCELARKCAAAGYLVIVVTARSKNARQDTVNWLNLNKIPFGGLCTRATGEDISAAEFKALAVDCIMSLGYVKEILFALDDNADVCSMYAARGINAFRRVPEGGR